MRRKLTFRLWHVLLFSFVLGIAASFPAYKRVLQQCVLCRAERTEYEILGVSFSRGFNNQKPFPIWYAAHRPAHDHQWQYSGPGCLWKRNFFGLPLTIYKMKHHPLVLVPPDGELLFVKRQDESTLNQFFADAVSADQDRRRNAAGAVYNELKNHSQNRVP